MWQIIRELVQSGVTIFLTTQYLEEADELADRVAVLDRGGVVAEGAPSELKRRVPGGHARLYFRDLEALDAAARLFRESSRDDEALVLQVPTDDTPDRCAHCSTGSISWPSRSIASPWKRPTSTTSSSH